MHGSLARAHARQAGVTAPREGRLELSAGFTTAIGQRERNEDFAAFCPAPVGLGHLGMVAAIADGVGGAKGGRVAAELAVRGFIDGHFGQDGLQGVRRTSARTLEALHAWITALGQADAALEGMACTFTALVLRGRQAHVIHVGDTRLYRLRDDALSRMTVDHTGAGGLKHVLTRAVGLSDGLRIDYAMEPARPHDRYLLCSDGVHGGLSDARLRDVLARRAGPEETASQLVEMAVGSHVGDNATALVVDVLDLPAANQADLELQIEQLPLLPAPAAGTVVDGFALQRVLSDGRYSRVFAAVDTTVGDEVIVKFPKPATGGEAVLRQAFLREAWIAARLHNPWLCEVVEVPLDRRSRLYTVMPLYRGETLEARLLQSRSVSLQAGVDIGVKLGKAVAALHRAGVIHRDIKPDNVILEQNGQPRLLDLGVARLPNMEDFPAADTPGTPSYMAPELLAGSAGDERSDLFALGVTLYRMFARSYPYGEVEPFSRPKFGRPVPLLTRRPDLPAWLDQAIGRAISLRPEDRYEDAVEFVFALEHGAVAGVAAPPRRRPLYDRNPLLFWQLAAAALAVALVARLAFG